MRLRKTFGDKRSARPGGPLLARIHSMKYWPRRLARGLAPFPRLNHFGIVAILFTKSALRTSNRSRQVHR